MAAIGNLEVDIAADIAKLTSAFKEGAKQTEDFGEAITAMAEKAKQAFEIIEAEVIFDKLAEGIKEVIEATSKGEQAFNQIKASIASTGGAAGVTSRQMEELATKMSRITGIPKSAIESGEAILLTFNRISKDVMPEAVEVMANLSAKMGGDMTDNARKLGRALQDPEKAAGLLKRAGVVLSEQQKDLIKSFQEAGEMAKAQGVILDALKTTTDGAAAANRDTLGGAFKQVKTDLESLWEALGDNKGFEEFRVGVEMVAIEIEKFTDYITQGKANTNDFLDSMGSGFQQAGHVATSVIGAMAGGFQELGKMAAGIWNLILAAFQEGFHIIQLTASAVTGHLFDGLAESMKKPWNDAMGLMGAGAQAFWGTWSKSVDTACQNSYKSTVGNFFQPFQSEMNQTHKDAIDKIKQLDDQLTKLRKNTNQGDGADGDGGKAAKAAAAAAEKQEAAEEKILDAANKTLLAKQNELAGTKELTGLEEGIATIMKGADVNDQEDMARRITAVNRLQATWQQIGKVQQDINAKKIDDTEVKNLDELLAKEKERLKDAQNLLSGQKQLSESEKAEAEIIKAMKGDISMHKDLQNQILETVRKRVEVEKQEKDDKAIAEGQKVLTNLEDQVKEAQLKVTGQKDLIAPLKEEEKLREDIAKLVAQGLDPAAAQQMLTLGQQQITQLAQLNQQLTQQDQTYQQIMSDTTNLAATQKKLNDALAAGTINQDQYDKGCIKLGEDMQKVAEKDAQQFVDVLNKGFDDAIKGGQSLDKIFQQIGKDLLMLLAKQLLFKPLSQWLGGGMQGGLGGLFSSIAGPIKNLLPFHAAGGAVPRGELSVIGEQGPELFMPSQGGMILPNEIYQLLMGLLGGGGMGMMGGGSGAGSFRLGMGNAGMGFGNGGFSGGGMSAYSAMLGMNPAGSSPITPNSLGYGSTLNNNTQLQISQDQFLARMNQDQMAYNQNPSAYLATRLAEDTNQYKFWQGQTPGSVSQMRWDSQGEFSSMQQLGLNNFSNIPTSVLQQLYGLNNQNYGLASGGAAMDVVGGDDGGGGWGLGPSSGNGMLGGGLTPGATSSPLFGPDPGGGGGSGSTNVPGSSWSSTGTADNAWQNGVPVGTNTQEFPWDDPTWGGPMNPNGTAGNTSWQNGFQTGAGTQDYQWANPNFQLGGNSPVTGATGSGASWSTGPGTNVYDYSGNNDTYTAGNTSQAQNAAQWADSFGAGPNTQDYATEGPMGYGGWTPDPSDPNYAGNNFWNNDPNGNGADIPMGNLLGMLNQSGGFLGGGSLDQLMQMFTGNAGNLDQFAGTALGPGGSFGSGGQSSFINTLMNMFGSAAAASSGYDPSQPFGGANSANAAGGRPLPDFPTLVGESGPEIWQPDSPGRIIPNNQTRGWTGDPHSTGNDDARQEYSNSGAPEINIHNHGSMSIANGGVSFSKNHKGRTQIDVMINDAIAAQVGKGRARNALVNNFQLSQRGVPRS